MAFNHVMVLMQAEVERFHAGVSMLYDYYNANVQEVLQDDSVALVSDHCSLPCPHCADRSIIPLEYHRRLPLWRSHCPSLRRSLHSQRDTAPGINLV